MRHAFAALLLASVLFAEAQADDFHGRILIGAQVASEDSQSLSALLGDESRGDALVDLRLSWTPQWGKWSFALDYELGADAGDTPDLTMKRAALGIFPAPPPATLWNLSDTFENGDHTTATQRIDRLSVAYTDAHLVLRLGRQALSWGSGMVFHPMDLFDPFAPGAIDTEYKPGADMIYAQWLFDDGSDLQAVVVPRPAVRGAGPSSDASSYALHYHAALAGVQTTWLLSRDHGDWVAGVGVDGSLGGAAWSAEIVPTFVTDGPVLTSLLANISDATQIADRDATLFAEFYRNGFGVSGNRYSLAGLPPPLVDRLVRGQVFDTGRDYLAAGLTLQWGPLVQLSPTLIGNLDDGSVYGFAQAAWSLKQDLNLIAGAQLPIGPRRSEFGGIPIAGQVPPYLEQPGTLYLQLRQYF